jgi:tRNA/rRNA methyltransferase
MTGSGTDKTKPLLKGGPAIILVRPQLAVNIGMCARAMANFGLSDLRLVAPKAGGPRSKAMKKGAYAAASGAVYILEEATLYDSVADAVADLNFLWATTARERGQGKRIVGPDVAMGETAARLAQGETHGLLFGPERTGLDNDEVAIADAIVTFPVNPAYASLNLAQAVLLTGYEWMRNGSGAAQPFNMELRSPPATREMVLSFFDYLEGALDARGFFRPAGKAPVMRRNMRNIYHRIGLTEQDIRTLRGALVRLVEGPRLEAKTRKRARSAKPVKSAT